MAAVVSIEVRVDNAQATQALNGIQQSLAATGTNGSTSMRPLIQAGADVDKAMLTNRESVRLASEEMGLRIPRAMQSVISNCAPAMAAISALSTAMIGIGFISIGTMIFKELDDLTEKWLNVNAAVDAYFEKSGRAATEKIIDTSSIETANAEMAKLIAKRDELQNEKKEAGIAASSGVMDTVAQYSNASAGANAFFESSPYAPQQEMPKALPIFDASKDKELADTIERIDRLKAHTNELTDKSKVAQINLENDAHQRALDLAKEKYENTLAQNKLENEIQQRGYDNAVAQGKTGSDLPHVVTISDDDAKSQYAADVAAANHKADSKENSDAKQASRIRELARLDAEANEAGMRGIDLMEKKREDALAQWTGKSADAAKARADINKKYDNDELERIQQLQDALTTAKADGLNGAVKLDQQHSDQMEKIGHMSDKASPNGGPSEKALATQAENLKYQQERARLEEDYVGKARTADDEVAMSAEQGYDRITAAAQKATNDANAEFAKQYQDAKGAWHDTDAEYAAHIQVLHDIDLRSDDQRLQLQQKAAQTMEQYDAQAAQAGSHHHGNGMLGMVIAHQEALQRIETDEAAHRQKLESGWKAMGLSFEQYKQADVDIQKVANSEIEEQNEQMRQRIAGTLESAFKDPAKYIENAAQKMMFNIVADWIMQLELFKRVFGETMNGGPSAGKSGGLMSHLLGGGAHGAGSPAGAPMAHGGSVGSSVGAIAAGAGSVAHGGGNAAGITSTGSGYWGVGSTSGGNSSSGYAPSMSGGSSASSYAPTMASGGSYEPRSTASAAADYGSVAQTGFTDFKMLRADYSHARSASAAKAAPNAPQAGAGVPAGMSEDDAKAAYFASDNGDGTVAAPMINSQSDVDDATAGMPSGGGMTHGQMAVAGLGAGLAAYGAGQAIWHDMATGGRSAGNQAKSIAGATAEGAMAGAAIGSVVPVIGTVIGAAVGAAIGFAASGIADITGESGKKAARKYFHEDLDPTIQGEVTGFRTGGGDFQSAIAGINKTARDGFIYAQKNWGGKAANYLMDTYLAKDVSVAVTEISKLAKAGSAGMKASAAQFHEGGTIAGFGDFATGSDTGWIHAMTQETVMNRDASTSPVHGPAIHAINQGADPGTLAAHYLSQMTGGRSGGSSGGDTHHHWDVTTMDSSSFRDMLRNGGAEVINGELNNFTGQYAGAGRQ